MTRFGIALITMLAGGMWLMPDTARAQACCAGSGAYLPARLQLHEQAAAALTLRGGGGIGTLDPNGTFVKAPAGSREVDLLYTLSGVVRFLRYGQVGLNVPFAQTYRAANTLRDMGGGLGDISASVRWDFTYAGQSVHLPGLALTASVTAPSGRPPEQAHSVLLTDATGVGTWQGSLGLGIEYVWQAWIVSINAAAGGSLPRHVDAVVETLGPLFTGLVGVAYVLPKNAAVAITASASARLDAWINGARARNSGQSLVTLGLGGAMPLTRRARLQVSFLADLPAAGRNEPVTLGGSCTFVWAWL